MTMVGRNLWSIPFLLLTVIIIQCYKVIVSLFTFQSLTFTL